MMNLSQKENLLRYVWQYRAYEQLNTVGGEPVTVNDSGRETGEGNGTCFCDAEIMIDGFPVRGTVRIFETCSGWNRWVVGLGEIPETALLVVATCDCTACGGTGEKPLNVAVPQVDPMLVRSFDTLVRAGTPLCGASFARCSGPERYSLLTRLTLERLDDKSEHVRQAYEQYGESWNDAARYLLFDTACIANKENRQQFRLLFDRIYRSRLLERIKTQEHVEALLFGMAGLLELSNRPDEYHYRLRTAFNEMRSGYRLEPVNIGAWRFGWTGNASSLWFVLAQLAAILHRYGDLAGRLLTAGSTNELRDIFRVEPSSYWRDHYYLSAPRTEFPMDRRITESKADLFIINMALPLFFAYRKRLKEAETGTDRIIEHLERIPAENNTFTRRWSIYVPADNALISQALIQLSKKYCAVKACYRCPLGILFLHAAVRQ